MANRDEAKIDERFEIGLLLDMDRRAPPPSLAQSFAEFKADQERTRADAEQYLASAAMEANAAENEEPKAETLPDPATPELKYLAAIAERLGVLIDLGQALLTAFEVGSETEAAAPRKTMRMLDGTEIPC